jgi:hypothetical protein
MIVSEASVETEWTSGFVETLKDHLRHGLSYGLAAREMGLSRSSILAKAKRLRERGDRFFALKRQGGRKAKNTIWSERESISATPQQPIRPTLVCVSTRPTLAPVHLPDSAPLGVTFLELKPGQCQYSIASDGDQHLFCGAPATNGWCAAHRARSYRKTAPIASSLARVA